MSSRWSKYQETAGLSSHPTRTATIPLSQGNSACATFSNLPLPVSGTLGQRIGDNPYVASRFPALAPQLGPVASARPLPVSSSLEYHVDFQDRRISEGGRLETAVDSGQVNRIHERDTRPSNLFSAAIAFQPPKTNTVSAPSNFPSTVASVMPSTFFRGVHEVGEVQSRHTQHETTRAFPTATRLEPTLSFASFRSSRPQPNSLARCVQNHQGTAMVRAVRPDPTFDDKDQLTSPFTRLKRPSTESVAAPALEGLKSKKGNSKRNAFKRGKFANNRKKRATSAIRSTNKDGKRSSVSNRSKTEDTRSQVSSDINEACYTVYTSSPETRPAPTPAYGVGTTEVEQKPLRAAAPKLKQIGLFGLPVDRAPRAESETKTKSDDFSDLKMSSRYMKPKVDPTSSNSSVNSCVSISPEGISTSSQVGMHPKDDPTTVDVMPKKETRISDSKQAAAAATCSRFDLNADVSASVKPIGKDALGTSKIKKRGMSSKEFPARQDYVRTLISQLRESFVDISITNEVLHKGFSSFQSELTRCNACVIALLFRDGSTSFQQPTSYQKSRTRYWDKLDLRSDVHRADGESPLALIFSIGSLPISPENGLWKNYFHLLDCVDAKISPNSLRNQKLKRQQIFWSLLSSTSVRKVGFRMKDSLTAILRYFHLTQFSFHPLPNVEDVHLAGWCLDPDRLRSDLQFAALCSTHAITVTDETGQVSTTAKTTPEIAGLVKDLKLLPVLSSDFNVEMAKASVLDAFVSQEMPLVPLLAEMEATGVAFDGQVLSRRRQALEDKVCSLVSAAAAALGHPVLLSSPEQVAAALYGELRLPKLQSNKTVKGKLVNQKYHSTAEHILVKLSKLHEFPSIVLEHRRCVKQLSTYIDPLIAAAQADTANPTLSRIYSSWNQSATGTGRLSSTNPNLQSLPKSSWSWLDTQKDDTLPHPDSSEVCSLGVRDAFCAASGDYELLAADYSQMEVRIAAHLSGDSVLCALFRNDPDADVYKLMAGRCFNKEPNQISQQERDTAKTISLGILYGIGPTALAEQLSECTKSPVTISRASQLLHEFLSSFPGIQDFIARTQTAARAAGCVYTISSRRRELPAIHSSDESKRSYAERQSVNSVVQGSAADMMKRAMLGIRSTLQELFDSKKMEPNDARFVLQLHDEIVLEIRSALFHRIAQVVKHSMEEVLTDSRVPFQVKIHRGKTLGSLVEVVSEIGYNDNKV